jgi:hypothetical protein
MLLRKSTRFTVILLAAASAVVMTASPALATDQGGEGPGIPNVHLKLFASAPSGASKPDDITRLGELLYVTYQNNAGKDGTPAGSTSTIVGFDRHTGQVVQTYTVTGRCDGLTADPRHHRILASVNEDLNSSLFVITPGHPSPITHYTYRPDPAQTGTDGTNGGTDAISVADDGTVYVAHSNPDLALPAPNNAAALYRMTLSGTTATLSPVFGINDSAKVINPVPGAPTIAPLGLTDPDSNRFLPGVEGGTLIQDAQADSKLVVLSELRSPHPALAQLNLTNATPPNGGAATPQLDDIERVTGKGTLYTVDQTSGNVYTIDTTGIDPGTLFVSQPAPSAGDQPNDPALGVVNPHTGVVTHIDTTMASPKGLLFVAATVDQNNDQNNLGGFVGGLVGPLVSGVLGAL